jgi:hypothetical protein
MDVQSAAKLNQVNPTLANIIRQLAAAVSSQYGGTIQVVSGYRNYASQAALYANRANNPNPVARPGTSKHGQGLAVDLRISGVSASTVGALGESMGLRWGGRFSKPDPGHFELLASASQDTGSATWSDGASSDNRSADGVDLNSIAPFLFLGLAALIVTEML